MDIANFWSSKVKKPEQSPKNDSNVKIATSRLRSSEITLSNVLQGENDNFFSLLWRWPTNDKWKVLGAVGLMYVTCHLTSRKIGTAIKAQFILPGKNALLSLPMMTAGTGTLAHLAFVTRNVASDESCQLCMETRSVVFGVVNGFIMPWLVFTFHSLYESDVRTNRETDNYRIAIKKAISHGKRTFFVPGLSVAVVLAATSILSVFIERYYLLRMSSLLALDPEIVQELRLKSK